jgi:hypothetical protein
MDSNTEKKINEAEPYELGEIPLDGADKYRLLATLKRKYEEEDGKNKAAKP